MAVLSPAFGLVIRTAEQAQGYVYRGRQFVLHDGREPEFCDGQELRARGYESAQVRLTGGGIALVNL